MQVRYISYIHAHNSEKSCSRSHRRAWQSGGTCFLAGSVWVYTSDLGPVLWPQPFDFVSLSARRSLLHSRPKGIGLNGGSRGIPSARNPRFAACVRACDIREENTDEPRPFIPLLLTDVQPLFLSPSLSLFLSSCSIVLL